MLKETTTIAWKIASVIYYLIDLYEKGIEVTGEEGDDVTQDIFIGAKGALEKLVWMLTATINEAPGL